jgi:sortase (surface protein transpeptidase)
MSMTARFAPNLFAPYEVLSVRSRLAQLGEGLLLLLVASFGSGQISAASLALDVRDNAAAPVAASRMSAPADTAAAAPALEAIAPTATAIATPVESIEPTATPVPGTAATAAATVSRTGATRSPPLPGAPITSGAVARVVIPRLGVNHYVTQLRVVNEQMQSPDADGVNAIGWYPEFGMPGDGGNAVFSAHETWNFYHGPFYSMHLAQPGDEVSVQMAGGQTYSYVVMRNTRYPSDAIPMGAVIWPAKPASEEWVTFITCGGRFVREQANGLGEYLDRDVVVARRVS